jgi:hypothetical protein
MIQVTANCPVRLSLKNNMGDMPAAIRWLMWGCSLRASAPHLATMAHNMEIMKFENPMSKQPGYITPDGHMTHPYTIT